MAPYQYRPLDPNHEEIRVLHLQPGHRDDPICLSIEHIPCRSAKDNVPVHFSKEKLREIQDSLPDSWFVYRTVEGRPIYYRWEVDGQCQTSWQSPIAPSNESHDSTIKANKASHSEAIFEAVSYAWGSNYPLSEVTVMHAHSPFLQAGTCSVGPNLFTMLKHLRRPDAVRTLWIDAICINQKDTLEKGEQIKKMRDIFMLAKRTVVWLGESKEDSTLALQALEMIGRNLEFTICRRSLPVPDRVETNWWNMNERLPLDPQAWEAIGQLMQRPYFERLWVVQEIELASERSQVQCGETEVLWYHVRRAFMRCHYEMAALPDLFPLSRRMQASFAEELSRPLASTDAKSLFNIASNRKCSDPRDRVFAMLGLLPPALVEHIKVLYELPVNEVYMQAFLATVRCTRRLVLLDIANQDEAINDYPSWVPDFTKSSYGRHSMGSISHASSASAAHVSFKLPNELHVCGILQGEIKAISPTTASHAKSDYPHVAELVSMHLPHMTEAECMDAYIWIVTQGNLSNQWLDCGEPSLKEAKLLLQQMLTDENVPMSLAHEYWLTRNMMEQQPGRFFVTDVGLLGCGPPNVLPGDKICVALGYDYPISLRPMNSGDQSTRYRLMGPVYIHGLMEGQALLGSLPSPWESVITDRNRGLEFAYHNLQTEEISLQDPRLGDLPTEWEEIVQEDEARSNIYVQHFKNKTTGETINSDPRLLPQALKARGVNLETFILV
jgi:hypothetical protein